MRRSIGVSVLAVTAVGVGAALWRQRRKPPDDPLTVVCALCGDVTDRWTSVLWQHEKGWEFSVEPFRSFPIEAFCGVCNVLVGTDIYTAVHEITRHVDQRLIPGGVNHAAGDVS